MKSVKFKLGLCVIVATLLALTSHIFVSQWSRPLIEQYNYSQQDPGSYQNQIIWAAYGTAFITMGLLVFLYYQAGHLLSISNRFLKSLVVAVIILEIKGDFFRQPLMDYILTKSQAMEQPFTFVFLNHVDLWVANLLMAFCLVYLCPTKKQATQVSILATR